MAKELRKMERNANGLLQHQQELHAVLETHFTNQAYINFKRYQVYHTIHPDNTAKGGSAVIIRNNILHHEKIKYKTEQIQATAVSIETKNCHTNIVALYCPPKHSIKKNEYLDLKKKQGNRFIIGGDFNAKHTHWGSRNYLMPLRNTKVNHYQQVSLLIG